MFRLLYRQPAIDCDSRPRSRILRSFFRQSLTRPKEYRQEVNQQLRTIGMHSDILAQQSARSIKPERMAVD